MDRTVAGVRTALRHSAGGRPSVRRASASTASPLSTDTVRRSGFISRDVIRAEHYRCMSSRPLLQVLSNEYFPGSVVGGRTYICCRLRCRCVAS